jgi:hypothetical protein
MHGEFETVPIPQQLLQEWFTLNIFWGNGGQGELLNLKGVVPLAGFEPWCGASHPMTITTELWAPTGCLVGCPKEIWSQGHVSSLAHATD